MLNEQQKNLFFINCQTLEDKLTDTIKVSSIKINFYALLSYVYFFFNSVGLPFGLLYTNLLTPVFYIWLWKHHQRFILIGLFVFLIPYDIIHVILGVEWKSFLKSNLLFISTYIFVFSFVHFINHYQYLGKLFKHILIANFIFSLIACVVFFTPYREVLWYIKKFTSSVDSLPRLALLTYEASYYSLLFIPIAFYYILKVLLNQNRTNGFYIMIMVFVPIILSLSIGVITASFFAFSLLFYINRNSLLKKKKFFYTILGGGILCILVLFILLIFFPENPVFVRIANIVTGQDTSANGRTIDSFTMAFRIAHLKSLLFGAGLGQIKILAPDIVSKYYYYWGELDVVRIPNTIAETLVIFGFTGLFLRLFIIYYLFLKTKVLTNYYRTALFIFIFLYQFTGSYITNIVEYVIWALAFSNVFEEFDVKKAANSFSIGIGL